MTRAWVCRCVFRMTSVENMSNRFDETLAKVNAYSPYFQFKLGMPAEPGWSRADVLLADSSWVAAQLARWQAKYGYMTLPNLAARYFDTYQWYVGAFAIGSFLAAARVPDVSPQNIALNIDAEGMISGVALLDERFACLPGDPAAGQAGVTILPNVDALRIHASHVIWAHVSQLIEPLRAASGVTAQTLRRASVNSQAALALWLLQQTGQPALGAIEACAFGEALPFPSTVKLFDVECDGERETFVNGSVCCYWNLDPENAAGSYCGNCPKVPLPERIVTLRNAMRERRNAPQEQQ
jgi:hypothetical protein